MHRLVERLRRVVCRHFFSPVLTRPEDSNFDLDSDGTVRGIETRICFKCGSTRKYRWYIPPQNDESESSDCDEPPNGIGEQPRT